MSGYYSNHSQSRFAPLSTLNTSNTASTNSTAASSASPSQTSSRKSSVNVPSKHFSLSVNNHNNNTNTNTSSGAASGGTGGSGDEKDKAAGGKPGMGSGGGSLKGVQTNGALDPSSQISVHPLCRTWIFWFRQQRNPGNKIISYEEGIKKISPFGSVESFWSLWTHLSPPSSLAPTTDYLLFHSGVRRPVWEDPLNAQGGKWIVRLKKGVADRLWEDLVIGVIGDQFQFDDIQSGEEDAAPEVCGCTISVRATEDIITVWNRSAADPRVTVRIRDTIRRVLNLPAATIMEYKTNNDSIIDKSSFRNSAVDRTPLT